MKNLDETKLKELAMPAGFGVSKNEIISVVENIKSDLFKFAELIVSSMQSEHITDNRLTAEDAKRLVRHMREDKASPEAQATLSRGRKILQALNSAAPSTVTSMQGDSEQKYKDALSKIKLRLHFMGWPAESYWNNGTDDKPNWIPDWRYEINLIENALHGTEITQLEKPSDTKPFNQLPSYDKVKPVSEPIDERAEFEKAFKLPDYVEWSENQQQYLTMPDEHRNDEFNGAWEGWQARSQLTTPSDTAEKSPCVNDAMDGYVLVPKEPTTEMQIAGCKVLGKQPSRLAKEVFEAMIAAARKP